MIPKQILWLAMLVIPALATVKADTVIRPRCPAWQHNDCWSDELLDGISPAD